MAEKEPVSLDALNGLLKERQRYEEWLAALEEKRANTSASVYQRVQADYKTRLREVSSKLAERAGELRENIDALTLRLEDVSRQESQQRDARQEAELRAAVGEYTDKQWKEIGGAWDKELARLVKEKAALDAQLNELNRIFALSVKEKQAEAIAAYDMTPGDPFHAKGVANGYVLTLGGKRIYFAGVTECVPEIKALRDIDIAFMPMNLPNGRMTPAAVADCVRSFKPKVVYPYHYDQGYIARLAGRGDPKGAAEAAASVHTLADSLEGTAEVRDANWYPAR